MKKRIYATEIGQSKPIPVAKGGALLKFQRHGESSG